MSDDHVYSKDSISSNFTELIISISAMSRAHEESKMKNYRRAKRWKKAKEQARETGRKITRKIPFWLPLPDRDGEFFVKDQELLVVKRIFELAANGYGYTKICQYLNQNVLLGEEDTDPNHKHLQWSREAKAQGDNRLERGRNFYQLAKEHAAKLGAPFNWSLQTVPGVAHSDSGMAKAAVSFIANGAGSRLAGN